jgi:asparagine synthase (glutamine-hydrolysing)
MTNLVEGSAAKIQKTADVSGWVAQWSSPDGFLILANPENHLAVASNSVCSVIFDGFLYNRREFVAEMELTLSQANDADVILHAFSTWQEDLVHNLRGVYSLAIWDKKRESLLYVRDHCGIYPSFYAVIGTEVIFSISVADIIRHPRVKPALNRSAFVDYLCHRRPVPEETFYTGIKRLLPGYAIRFTGSTQNVRRYWYSTPPEGIQDYITDPIVPEFDESLEQAVQRCMQIGKAGIFLSGGFDSVSIACIATDLSKREGSSLPIALSLGFPHPDCNEVDRQKSVAQQLGLQAHLRKVEDILGSRSLHKLALELGKTWSQPMWDTWQPLYIPLGIDGREMGCKVILTGSGGDEWLSVGEHLIADLIRMLDFRSLDRTVKIYLRSYPPDLPKSVILRHLFWGAGLRLILADHAGRIARQLAPGTLRKMIRKRLRKNTLSWVASDPQLKAEANDRIEMLVDKYMTRFLPNDKYPFYAGSAAGHFVDSNTSMMMEQHFESSRRMGVSLLYPYFDPDVINLLVRVSPQVLQQGGMEKGIVRKAVARRFPDLKFEKQRKVSAGTYWQSMILAEGRDLYYESGGPKTLMDLGIVDSKKVDTIIHQAFASRNRFDNAKIWDLLLLETWARAHNA